MVDGVKDGSDKFNFLVVTIGIIVGLALTHLLIGIGFIIQKRDQIQVYWLHLSWVAALFLILILYWWALSMWKNIGENFFRYLVEISIPLICFLIAAVLMPDLSGEQNNTFSFEDYYYNNNHLIFGFASMCQLLMALHHVFIIEEAKFYDKKSILRFMGFLCLLALAFTDNRIIHELVSPLFILVVVLFVIAFRLKYGDLQNTKSSAIT